LLGAWAGGTFSRCGEKVESSKYATAERASKIAK
jgi:hypothetical protein